MRLDGVGSRRDERVERPGVTGRTVELHDVFEVRTGAADRLDRLADRRVGDHGACAGVRQPVFEHVGTEQRRQRDGDGTPLPGRAVGDERLGALGGHHADGIADPDAQVGERPGQRVRPAVEFSERERLDVAVPVLAERRGVRVVLPEEVDAERSQVNESRAAS